MVKQTPRDNFQDREGVFLEGCVRSESAPHTWCYELTACSTGVQLGIKVQQQKWRRSITPTHLLAAFLLHVPTVLCFVLLEASTRKKEKEK